ncbi:MAG: hypothetical protein KA401_03065 [Anaerolineae bacterium]|nr:hypothetical protein [Anaerolineae bacterium]
MSPRRFAPRVLALLPVGLFLFTLVLGWPLAAQQADNPTLPTPGFRFARPLPEGSEVPSRQIPSPTPSSGITTRDEPTVTFTSTTTPTCTTVLATLTDYSATATINELPWYRYTLNTSPFTFYIANPWPGYETYVTEVSTRVGRQNGGGANGYVATLRNSGGASLWTSGPKTLNATHNYSPNGNGYLQVVTLSPPYPQNPNHWTFANYGGGTDGNFYIWPSNFQVRMCRGTLTPTSTPSPTMTPTPTSTPNPDDIDGLLLVSLSYPSMDDLALTIDAIRSADLPSSTSISFDFSTYGVCDSSNRLACAKYAYLAFFGFFMEYTGNPPSVWDLLSVTFHGELPDWGEDLVAAEALARNFLDGTAGGCKYVTSTYDCSYSNIVMWMSTMQYWLLDPPRGYVGPTQVTVDLFTLLGIDRGVIHQLDQRRLEGPISTEDFHAAINIGGMFDYDGFMRISMNNHISWRTGQGPDVPSVWGNQVLTLGSTIYTGLSPTEHFQPLIRHIFTKTGSPRVYGITAYPNPNTTPPQGYALDCTLLSIITTTQGRITVSACD